MRRKIFTLLLAAAVFMAANPAFSQKEQNQVVITAGVGYSLGLAALKALANTGLRNNDLEEIKSTPLINGMVDYGITDNFSIGAAYTFHKWTWTDQYTDTSGVMTTGKATAQRQNIAGRALFHFGNADNMDMYAGARLGTSLWKFTAESNDSQGNSASDFSVPSGVFSVQALFGVRAYFNEFIGANFEVGLGTAPYFIAGGISVKI